MDKELMEKCMLTDEETEVAVLGIPRMVDENYFNLTRAIRKAQLQKAIPIRREDEADRILRYLKSLLASNPRASLEATIDLIETTKPENYTSPKA